MYDVDMYDMDIYANEVLLIKYFIEKKKKLKVWL